MYHCTTPEIEPAFCLGEKGGVTLLLGVLFLLLTFAPWWCDTTFCKSCSLICKDYYLIVNYRSAYWGQWWVHLHQVSYFSHNITRFHSIVIMWVSHLFNLIDYMWIFSPDFRTHYALTHVFIHVLNTIHIYFEVLQLVLQKLSSWSSSTSQNLVWKIQVYIYLSANYIDISTW